jgi:hypothetical protein
MSATKYFSMSVAELKSLLNIDTINVYTNNDTGAKSFRVIGEDETPVYFRVAREFDGNKPAVFITSTTDEDGNPDWFSGALINSAPKTHTFECSL